MKKVIFIFTIICLFIGCSQRVSHTFEKIDPNDPIIKHKHFTMNVPNETPVKWDWIRTNYYDNNVIISHYLQHFDKNRKSTGGIWKDYHLEIGTRSAENYKPEYNDLEHELRRLKAIKEKDEQYLKDYYSKESFKKDGIISLGFESVNKYQAIVITMHKKYMDMDKYSKHYSFYSYSKTGKLKRYDITISTDIDKPNADDPELLVEYSFEDMLKRSQRSLDSFTPTDEDFIEGKFSEYFN